MRSTTKSAARISIPIVAFAAIASILMWLGDKALANENRITRRESLDLIILEMRNDIKDIKRTQVKIMLEVQHLRDTSDEKE